MDTACVVDVADRLELFVDRHLVDTLWGVHYKLHAPQPAPAMPDAPAGHYMTVIHDQAHAPTPYRAYYRNYAPDFTQERYDGDSGEIVWFSSSSDGHTWQHPSLNRVMCEGTTANHGVLRSPPYSHNFAPFLDANPHCPPAMRYKALAGLHPRNGKVHDADGLHAFGSADGIAWSPLAPQAVITQAGFAFDSQNIAFWSEVEKQYVCYYRCWQSAFGFLRSIARCASPDFLNWTTGQPMHPNLPGEHLYTSQITPYFRAPHHYLALPTRFMPDRGDSTDILFMSTRAGSGHFDRLFTEAFIRPGLDARRWGNRSNYAAAGILPVKNNPNEISLYHGPAGLRYTLRTDGFISLHASGESGIVFTRPLRFQGQSLTLNMATSAAGCIRVELQDVAGNPLAGRSLDDCLPTFGDSICQTITWKDGFRVDPWQGQPIRLKFELREADVFALQFAK